MAKLGPNKERVRLNQQRSRARKVAYMKDLEQHARNCRLTHRSVDTERELYQQVCKENQLLRAFLHSGGVTDTQINAFINNHTIEQPSKRSIRPNPQSTAIPTQVIIPARPDTKNDQTIPIMGLSSSSAASQDFPAQVTHGLPEVEEFINQDIQNIGFQNKLWLESYSWFQADSWFGRYES